MQGRLSAKRHGFTIKTRRKREKKTTKAVQKEPTDKSRLDLKLFISRVRGKHSAGREFQSLM